MKFQVLISIIAVVALSEFAKYTIGSNRSGYIISMAIYVVGGLAVIKLFPRSS